MEDNLAFLNSALYVAVKKLYLNSCETVKYLVHLNSAVTENIYGPIVWVLFDIPYFLK